MLGVGVPLPVLNESELPVLCKTKTWLRRWWTSLFPSRPPTFGLVSYAQLKSGRITVMAASASCPLAKYVPVAASSLELKKSG